MTDHDDWVTLSQVHKRLAEILESRATAETFLLEALRSEKVAMAADYFMNGNSHPEKTLQAGNFRDARFVVWDESRVEHKIERTSLGKNGQTHYHMGDFHSVKLSNSDIIALWPAFRKSAGVAIAHAPISQSEVRNKGGRPAKYDWAAAGGALAGHMYGAGIQESSKLKLFVLAWFRSEHGQAPDERDVEKFVAAALSAFDRAAPKG